MLEGLLIVDAGLVVIVEGEYLLSSRMPLPGLLSNVNWAFVWIIHKKERVLIYHILMSPFIRHLTQSARSASVSISVGLESTTESKTSSSKAEV